MAKRFLTPIQLTNLTSDPGGGTEGQVYFNTTDKDIKYYADSQWSSITSSIIGFGVSYPNSPSNGQLFYNVTTGRMAIYYDSVWRELAYFDEIAEIDGGFANTLVFDGEVDAGGAGLSVFVNLYDGGTLSGFIPPENPTGGSAGTEDFSTIFDNGNADTTVFALTIDSGSA